MCRLAPQRVLEQKYSVGKNARELHRLLKARAPDLVGPRIVIHAGARPIRPNEVDDILARLRTGETTLVVDTALPLIERLASASKCRGVIKIAAGLSTAILGKPRRVDRLFQQPDSDRVDLHMWAWPLTRIEPFDAPIPMRGAQGFWTWPAGKAVSHETAAPA